MEWIDFDKFAGGKNGKRTGILGFEDWSSAFIEGFVDGVKPRELLEIPEWCNRNIKLAGSASAEPGFFRWQRTPYVRGIYDALENDNDIREVVWIAGAQVAKTQSGNNWLLYLIPNAPGPFLYVAPSVDLAKLASKQRIAPLIEDCDELRTLLPQGKRDSGNTVLLKEYDGGILRFTGANSAAGLRSMPARYLYCDEIDAFPANVDGEGDPIDLARKRLTTYKPVSKTFLTSTPTVKGKSAIEREFLQTDMRYYFVPCPHCNHFHVLQWKNMMWDGKDASTARMICPSCHEEIAERHKTFMLENGEWRATSNNGRKGAAGFHLSSLYSPLGWLSWPDMVQEWIDSQDNPEKLQTFINTRLAETWEEKNESIQFEVLEARAETFSNLLPAGIRLITTSSDVQDDRIETLVLGWGKGEECWILEQKIFYGNLEQSQIWTELAQFLDSKYEIDVAQFKVLNRNKVADGSVEDGSVDITKDSSGKRFAMGIHCSVIDTGGHFTDSVLRFCAANRHKKIYPIKGSSTSGRDIIYRSSSRNAHNVELKLVGTDTAKDKLFARFLIDRPGPGYIHFSDSLDREFFEQLTAEKLVSKYVKGRGTVKQYVKIRKRNEALDLMVYGLASLYSKGSQFLKRLNSKDTSGSGVGAGVPLHNVMEVGSEWVGHWNRKVEEVGMVEVGNEVGDKDSVEIGKGNMDKGIVVQGSKDGVKVEATVEQEKPVLEVEETRQRRQRKARVQHNPNFAGYY